MPMNFWPDGVIWFLIMFLMVWPIFALFYLVIEAIGKAIDKRIK